MSIPFRVGGATLVLSLVLASCGQTGLPPRQPAALIEAQALPSGLVSGGVYRLLNVNSKLALDVAGVSTASGAGVLVWSVNNQANQSWKIEDAGGGYATLKAQHSGQCLDVLGAGTANGTRVQQFPCNGTGAQKFKFVDVGGGAFKLLSALNTAQALDVAGGGTAGGTKVQIWSDNGSGAQRWTPVRLDAGTTGDTNTGTTGDSLPNTLQTLIDDMTLPHEAQPHGVPDSFNWAKAPRVGMGNAPGSFRALTAWGQLYEAAEGNPATNTRVQLRDIQTYLLSKADGTWHRLQNDASVGGAAYVEDFAGDVNKPADLRAEPSGGVSVTAGGGYNFHFWPSGGRATIDPNDVGGVWTTVRARLITADAAKPDDRAQARYVLGMGADYWLSVDAQWDQWKTNGDVGIGRFKYVQQAWQSFNMTSLTADQLRRTPPPLN